MTNSTETQTRTSTSVVDSETPTLSITDRCDRCSAQAYVMTRMPSGSDLLWCGHHFAGNEPQLVAKGATIVVDSRHMLTA